MDRALTVRRAVAVLAAAFGVETIVAGARVIAGADPGNMVYRPQLWFNTAMGLAYLAAALVAWHDAGRGRLALIAIAALHLTGEAVAEPVRAQPAG